MDGDLERGVVADDGALGVIVTDCRVTRPSLSGFDVSSDAGVLTKNRVTKAGGSAVLLRTGATGNLLHGIQAKGCSVAAFDVASGGNTFFRNRAAKKPGGTTSVDGLWSRNRASKSAGNGFWVGNPNLVLIGNRSKSSGLGGLHLESPGDDLPCGNQFD